MKPSLWDLKLFPKRTVYASLNDHEAIPMGFETSKNRRRKDSKSHHEAIPMGFETITLESRENGWLDIMKPSLWDLKLINNGQPSEEELIMKPSLWDLKHFSGVLLLTKAQIMKPSLWDLKLRLDTWREQIRES